MGKSKQPWWERSNEAQLSKDPEVLRRLAKDISIKVRIHVAANPSTPEDVIRYLERKEDSTDWRFLEAFSRNPKTSVEMLHTIAQMPGDRNPQYYAGASLCHNPSTPLGTLLWIAENHHLPSIRTMAMSTIEERGILSLLGD